ncbi:hypothetical protein D3Z53_04690 [Lachnospiraceae bacterium]|jgi:hypothetical protein|nr:hypothetical protein [Lachnospiraceae bacterium]
MKEIRSRKQLSQKSASQNPNKRILCSKIDTAKRRKQSGKNPGPGKSLNFYRTASGYLLSDKKGNPFVPMDAYSRIRN